MKHKNLLISIIIPIILSTFLSLSGCSNIPFSKPTATLTSYPTIRPAKPTRTPTALPTSTATQTETPTVTPTATLPPPLDDFSQARLYSSGPRPGWDFAIIILLPEDIRGEYSALVGDDPVKPFTCRPLTEYAYPDRLYCSGRQPGVDKQVIFKILEKNTNQVVFKGFVYLPLP
jgi:hypothetical protein